MNADQKLEIIKKHIGVFPDFPKKGIVFRDVFAALTNSEVCIYLRDLLVEHIKLNYPDVDLIVGLESRGFLFNLLIASELGVGCAPIRKKGKLPGECISVEYTLEYGSDIFEMQKSAIKPGQKVVIVDDLLATGGSLEAAIKLLRKAGAIVQEGLVVLELVDLGGRKRLDCNVHSLIKYE
ncbi:adenine phosphoribosyltransferase [Eupeodes corollae]|uniref:adenine phosphoribosyltransferase n=1 Tax=Eupeodes corollae TaxID=290404 RepID=UPI0024915189|nr:adenine phosphoribosyltransferase [Eupeodes corollae]